VSTSTFTNKVVYPDVNVMKWDLSEKRFLEICNKINNKGKNNNDKNK
jgi:hypothetical protein